MTKKEYLEYGIKYLALKTITEQVKFLNSIEKKFPIAKLRIFKNWIGDVNRHESHIKSKQNNEYYLKRLDFRLTPKKK